MNFCKDVRPIRDSARGGRLWPTLFISRALRARSNVFVYTPPGLGPDDPRLDRLPVLYLLHGMHGSEIDWPFKGDALAILDREIGAGRVAPMVVAMPNDGLAYAGTFYTDWHCGRGPFERYLVEDVRRFVEGELVGGLRPRARRFIAGLSMGGYGAVTLALRRPSLFAATASLSGAVGPLDRIVPRLCRQAFGPVSRDPASYRRRRDPNVLAAELGGRAPALYLDCGRSDFLISHNRKFHRRLEALGVPHAYHEYGGAHNWPSWRKRLPHALRFLSSCL